MNNNFREIRQKGYNALTKELGAVGATNFIRQFENGYGNYTEERQKELRDVTIDDIVETISKRKMQKFTLDSVEK